MRLPFWYAAIVETIAGVETYGTFWAPPRIVETIAGVATRAAPPAF